MHLQCLPPKKLRAHGYVDNPLLNIVYVAIWMLASIMGLYAFMQLNCVVVFGQLFSA